MSNKIKYLNDDNFTQEISDKVVLVDFFAEWCGPCKMIAPIIDELAEDFDGQATIAKVDIDSSQKTASDKGVTSIPTIIVYKNGEEVAREVGVRDKDALAEMIKNAL